MRPTKTAFLSLVCFVGMTLGAAAQSPYPTPPYAYAPAVSPAQLYPPSWSYDPYTSGTAPCPQRLPGDLSTCRQNMPPTSGQPSYWSGR